MSILLFISTSMNVSFLYLYFWLQACLYIVDLNEKNVSWIIQNNEHLFLGSFFMPFKPTVVTLFTESLCCIRLFSGHTVLPLVKMLVLIIIMPVYFKFYFSASTHIFNWNYISSRSKHWKELSCWMALYDLSYLICLLALYHN